MTNPADHLLLKISKNHGWGEPHKSFEIDEQTKTMKTMINLGMLPEEYLPKPEIIYSSDTCKFLFPEKIDEWPDNLFDLLGLYEVYDPKKEGRIILYEECIKNLGLIYYNMIGKYLGQSRQFCINMVREIVLWHELGHWITHWMPGSDGYRWNNSTYMYDGYGTNDLHEGLAQLLVFYSVINIDEYKNQSDYFLMFDFMIRKQAPCYHKHIDIMNHGNFSWNGILRALTILRITEDHNITLDYLLGNLPQSY